MVAIDGREERIRFCGIDAPEMKQPLGEQSRTSGYGGELLDAAVWYSSDQPVHAPVFQDRRQPGFSAAAIATCASNSPMMSLWRMRLDEAPTIRMATYLITGANRGIGYEYCRQLQARGETVIAVCRNASPELQQLGIQVEEGIDITADDSIANLKIRLGGRTIDILINNAGILAEETLETLNFDSIREQFEVNALGALRVTHALLPNLKAGSKVVLMTSRMGSIADNTSGSYYGYRMSKAALSMAGKSLSHDLKPHGVAVAILHPGLVQTRMTDFYGITPQDSVQGLLARIDELTLKNTGTFWHANGEVLPW